MKSHQYLAFDLGASNGRAFLGILQGQSLQIKELSRFPNEMVSVRGRLHWNVIQLLQEIKRALAICAREATTQPESIGLDTWGVDFGLLASDGGLLSLPVAYRDRRTEGAMEAFFRRVPRARIYELTGVQLMAINTLFQLYAMVREESPLLKIASDLLMMPDLFSYLLTGRKRAEFTIATTSQLYNPTKRGWDDELLGSLGIPNTMLQEIVSPGTVVGRLEAEIAREAGLSQVPVMATASHDTGAAVAAAPAEGEEWAYISSGTWSLMGVETQRPIITEESLNLNFSNEGGVGGAFRVLKNIAGFWLLQQCRQAWAKDKVYSYQQLTEMARSAKGFASIIEPDHATFMNPPDMPEAICEFCRQTRQEPPGSPAEFVRCILVSLALKYRFVLEQLRRVNAHPIRTIHVIGGGSQNELLCQLTAEVTGIPVVAGPVEATVIGNMLVQAMGLGHVDSPSGIRATVRESFPVKRYEPAGGQDWEEAYGRFHHLHERCMS